jgi:hypothetical protein
MTGLQTKLGIAKSTVSWRVQRALKGGWLKNLEVRRGHQARLVLGEPMPDAASALPTVERVREVFESGLQDVTATKHTSYLEVFECSSQNLERPDGNKMVASAAACVVPESFEL